MKILCPVCHSDLNTSYGMQFDNGHLFSVLRCLGDCGCLYVSYPENWNIHAIYEGSRYHVDRQNASGHEPYEDRYDHDYMVGNSRLDYVERYSPVMAGRSLIDVGCSNGALVAAAKSRGYKPSGCDISSYIIDVAKKKTGLDCFFVHNVDSGPFPDECVGVFDIVQCNDVIEHSDDPVMFMRRIASLLSSNGMAFVDTPDFSDVQFSRLGLSYRHVKPIEHSVMLDKRSLTYIAEEAGCAVCDIYSPIDGKIVLVARKKS